MEEVLMFLRYLQECTWCKYFMKEIALYRKLLSNVNKEVQCNFQC